MRNVADIMEDRLFDLAALMAYEVGKSRLEALGDVQETAELIRWNCRRDGEARGVPHADERHGRRRRLLRRPAPVRGVGGHQPVQLPDGALGRTVVRRARRRQRRGAEAVEPGRVDGLQALRVLPRRRRAGRRVPPGDRPWCVRRRRSSGSTPTWAASRSPARTRWAWTSTSTSRTSVPKPVICEMGGKNPAIVTKSADLDKATDGVLRSAFGFGGQKCSACSRVFVEREVYDDFLGLLKEKTEKIKVGNPIQRDVYLGPIINEPAMETFEEAADEARKNGTIVTGGNANHRRRPRAGLVRRADDRRGAGGQLDLEEGAVRAVRRGGAVRRARRRDREGQRHRVRPDRRVLQRGQGRGRTSGSTASRRASST